MADIFEREESFHDSWASSVRLDEIPVDASFECCTAPEARQICNWLGNVEGKKLLDLGCGLGEASVYFAKQGANVTASDISGKMLEVVQRLAKNHCVELDCIKCPSNQIDAPNETFDVVYCGNLLHHVDIEETLIEIKRVLKTGGAIVSWDPLVHNPLIQIYRFIATSVRTVDERPLNIKQISLFKKYFKEVRYDCFWFLTLWIFLRFLIIERVSPNSERYWKKIIKEHQRLEPTYNRLEKIDKIILGYIPYLKRFCWNIAIHCKK